jgi:hypothetical protein
MHGNEIVYPVFLECCQFSEDKFWESIFEDLAYGKPPYGTYISKGSICCNHKNKEFSYKIERKNPQNIHDDLYKLFTEKLGISSHRQKQKRRIDFHQIEKEIKDSRQKWSDIRKKNVKDLLIERYVIKLREKHSLSIKSAKYLLSIISLALVFKIISSKDIIYENEEIKDIEGIDIDGENIFLKHEMFKDEGEIPLSQEGTTTITKKMSDNWEKYLKQFSRN